MLFVIFQKAPRSLKSSPAGYLIFHHSISLAPFHLLIKFFSLDFTHWLFWLFASIPEREFRSEQEPAFTVVYFTAIYNSLELPISGL